MNKEILRPSGDLLISDIAICPLTGDEFLFKRRYSGYSPAVATKLFKETIKPYLKAQKVKP